MSLHFLIDGYNVIKQVDSLKDMRSLRNARMSLVKIIQGKRLLKGRGNQVTIVFDGRDDFNLSGALTENRGRNPIKIIFSKGESADETIKRMLDGSANPRQSVVVTDDKAIIFFSRSLGATAMPVCEFLGQEEKQLNKRLPKQRRQKNAELLKIELTHQQQESINQELRRIWE